jgi:hypothetical protein
MTKKPMRLLVLIGAKRTKEPVETTVYALKWFGDELRGLAFIPEQYRRRVSLFLMRDEYAWMEIDQKANKNSLRGLADGEWVSDCEEVTGLVDDRRGLSGTSDTEKPPRKRSGRAAWQVERPGEYQHRAAEPNGGEWQPMTLEPLVIEQKRASARDDVQQMTAFDLNAAVAMIEGRAGQTVLEPVAQAVGSFGLMLSRPYEPATNWADGGPLIAAKGIAVTPMNGEWGAVLGKHSACGQTPLMAAMRVYVASTQGE